VDSLMAEELYQLPRRVAARRRRLLTFLVLLSAGSVVAGVEAAGWWFGRAFGHPAELGALLSWPNRLLVAGLGSVALLGLSLSELREERRAQLAALALAGLWWAWGLAAPVYSPAVLASALRKLARLGAHSREIREAVQFGAAAFAIHLACASWCLRVAWRRLSGPGDAYGSARFAREDEVRKREDLGVGEKLAEGIVLGAVDGGYLRHGGDSHVLVFAPPGGGKTTCVVVPTALAHPGPLVVLDAKREIYKLTSGFRRRAHGSRVLCWAPSGGEGFSRHNPMLEIRDHPYDVRDAQRIAGSLIASVPTNTDPFWREAPRQILVGALLHGKYCREWGSLPRIYQLFTVGGRKAIEQMARAPHDPALRFGWTDPKGRASATHPAVAAAAENILEMSPQTRSSVVAAVSAALSIYADPVLALSVSASDFSLREITRTEERPVTLYLCFEPDERDRLGPHLRVVVSQLAGAILERDASRRWAWRERILLLLDEFPVLGAIREIEQGLAYFRGYGASFLVVVQYLGQLIQAFGREEAVSPNCAVQVAFAPTDLATAERLSSLSGRQTIEIDQVSRSSTGLGSASTSRQTVLQGRSLLDASEFRRLGRDQAVVFLPGLAPLVVRKRPYFADPALLRWTSHTPWHEPPGAAGGEALASGSAGAPIGSGGLDAEDGSRERRRGRDREGAKERSYGGA
jgi:type IV secretion system protein VirD4